MYRITQDGVVRFSRPYPFDLERKQKIERVMFMFEIRTVSDLAIRLNMRQNHLSELINGTRISKKTEDRVAAFFGMKREELFILRTTKELIAMHEAQDKGKGAA